jgi:clan AA aspartic protease
MGITYVDGTVRGPTGQEVPVRMLVDSGAMYSLLPTDVWQEIGLEETRQQDFRLADGTIVRRRISECYLMLDQGETHTPVILGEPGDGTLLGVVTLEELGLVFNPFNRTLHPITAMLA